MSKTIQSVTVKPSTNRVNDFLPLDGDFDVTQRWTVKITYIDSDTHDENEHELSLEEYEVDFTTWTHAKLNHHNDSDTIIKLFKSLILNTVNDSTHNDIMYYGGEKVIALYDTLERGYNRNVTHHKAFIAFVKKTMPLAPLQIDITNINDLEMVNSREYLFYSCVKLVIELITYNYYISNGTMRGGSNYTHNAPFYNLTDLTEWCKNQ